MWLLKVGSGTVLFCKKAAVIFAGTSEPWFWLCLQPLSHVTGIVGHFVEK